LIHGQKFPHSRLHLRVGTTDLSLGSDWNDVIYFIQVVSTISSLIIQRKNQMIGRLLSAAVPLALVAGAVIVAVLYFSGNLDSSDLPQVPESLTSIFIDSDPFQGFTLDNASKWKTGNQGGLELEIWNACEDQWTPYFDTAVSQWDAGTPDVLTLYPSRVDVDPDCTAVDGLMKVCNNDYGDTQYRGINEVLILDGFILSSVAKMNDYYLANEGDAFHQYTMCHEVRL
jgi:hypothetical protein